MVLKAVNLRDRVILDKETSGDDGFGNPVTGYAEQFREPAKIRFLRGTEPVIAARLTGVQPVVVTVRRSTRTEEISPAWRIRDARSSAVFNVRAVTPTDDRRFIDVLCDQGRG